MPFQASGLVKIENKLPQYFMFHVSMLGCQVMSPEGFKLIKITNATDAWENWVLFLVSFPSRQIPPVNGVLGFFWGQTT